MSAPADAAAPVSGLSPRGNGVAHGPRGRLEIPFAAPGDRVRLADGAVAGLDPVSPHRAEPPCPLFGRCGGCSVQHLDDATYAAWKSARVAEAFAARSLAAPVAPLVRSPLASRRRATLTAVRSGTRTLVGYRARGSHELVDVPACPALDPRLAAALPALRDLAARAAAPQARLTATLCANGIDVAITRPAAKGRGSTRRRNRPAGPPMLDAADPAVLRVTLDGEPLWTREAPVLRFGEALVTPPPAAFLQPTIAGEAALTALVEEGTAGARRIADLFAGIGTFALPLSRRAAVLAVELDGEALTALAAARRPAGLRPVETLRRNLVQHPLAPSELDRFDAVVFDPPRAGARQLAASLAGSRVPQVVAVSCEPSTLARDCALLVAGGYTLTQVTPVDQFVATAHIEAVAFLRRDP